ncbi:SHOCT domain-containing protein [Agathobacter rectalis]|uniref:SHOCT domain-containing protein n=1 Tax=Agathobacter rectalis TaxID=39491 RepID=UPI0026B739D8|nr:SHOCT domain-containing protein [Agathobacter rectalis]
MNNMSNLFVDANEKEISTLGSNYLRNFLSTGSLENGFCTVTDKRVYFRGKCYTKSGNNYKSTKEEKTVDLKDVTGTGFTFIKRFWLMILAILCTIWAVVLTFSLVASLPELNESEGWSSILLVIFVAILPTIVLWGLYWFLKVKVFEISFAGGKIAFKASSYNENEVNNFQRALRQAKDNYKEAPNTVSNSSGADELKKYKDLLDSGVISQADFDNAKKKILG